MKALLFFLIAVKAMAADPFIQADRLFSQAHSDKSPLVVRVNEVTGEEVVFDAAQVDRKHIVAVIAKSENDRERLDTAERIRTLVDNDTNRLPGAVVVTDVPDKPENACFGRFYRRYHCYRPWYFMRHNYYAPMNYWRSCGYTWWIYW